MFPLKVAKFGGTSLADAAQIRKVIDIVHADPCRRVVVVSAPGKRHKDDQKITDLLLAFDASVSGGAPYSWHIDQVVDRYRGIASDLGVDPRTEALRELYGLLGDALVSRGEYLMARYLADALGFAFCDAIHFIHFDRHAKVDWEQTNRHCAGLSHRYARGVVVPGFYGAMPDGRIKTFSRGGSDITGAILAAALEAQVYENWTDVSGTLMADPRVVEAPRPIPTMTYQEMRELAYAGANVLHDEAVFPVRKAGIPIHIRNTNAPSDPGTRIVPDEQAPARAHGEITGIAARKGFCVLSIEKAGMNDDLGYGYAVLGILKHAGVSWEHLPGSIDSLSVVIHSSELDGKLESLASQIAKECAPDRFSVKQGLSLICTVGQGMAETPGVLARLAGALAHAGISIRVVDQGASEISIIVGVEDTQCEQAVRAIYGAFATQQPPQ